MINRIRRYSGVGLLVLFDLLTLKLSFEIAFYIRAKLLPVFINLPDFPSGASYGWIFPVFILFLFYEGLYTKHLALWDEIRLEIKSCFLSFIAILVLLFISKRSYEYSRAFLTTYFLTTIFLLPIARRYYKRLIFSLGLMQKRCLIIGSKEVASRIISALEKEKNLGYKIAGIIDDTNEKRLKSYKIHKGIAKIERYIKASQITDVIIAKEDLKKDEIIELINHLQHKVQNIIYPLDISGIAVYGTEIRHFFMEQSIAIEIKNNLANPITYLTKRVSDYILALIIFVVILPFMVLIGLLIKLTSKGPVIFSQKRIGKNGKEFKCYKFRTMYIDAKERLDEILKNDPKAREEWEKNWKIKNDPRVTPIGGFLRKTSLDELPQILNVLKGDMSLVGPRPVVKEEIERYYKDKAHYYYMVPPGITGLWQVSGRSNTTYEDRVSLDIWYVRNWNLWLDIVILFKTIKVVFKREGAY